MHTHFDFLYLLLSLSGLCRTENIHINGNRRGDILSPSFCDSIGPYWHGFLHSLLPSTLRGKKCIFPIVSLSVRPFVCLSLTPSGQIALSCWLYLREAPLSFSFLQPFTHSHIHKILPDRLGKMCAGNLPE